MTDEKDIPDKGRTDTALEFIQIFRRGVEYTERVLAENERLLMRLAKLDQENYALLEKALAPDTFKELTERIRLQEVENKDYAERFRELETEYDRMANLYVTSYQLHSTLNLQDVVRISFEILMNLVGAKRFVLYVADGSTLVPVQAQGMEIDGVGPVRPGEGIAGRSAEQREVYMTEAGLDGLPQGEPGVCVPLQVAERLIGMLVVFEFLSQKESLTELDNELLRLLATHAGMALYASALSAKVGADARDVVEVLRSIGD